MKRLYVLLLSVSFLVNVVYAVTSNYYDSGNLTCNLVTSISQDSKEFVWIGTEYGLNKTDGTQFYSYLHNDADSTSLLGNSVKKLYYDKANRLWIGLANGVQIYNKDADNFTTIPFPDGINPSINGIIQLSNGEIWIYTDGRGIFKYDSRKNAMVSLDKVRELTHGKSINNIFEDKSHRIWFTLKGSGLVCLNLNNKLIAEYSINDLHEQAPIAVTQDNDENIYVAVSGSVLILDKDSGKFQPLHISDDKYYDIRDIITTRNGNIYVGTFRSGVLFVDRKNRELKPLKQSYFRDFNLNSAKVVTIMDDNDGNLWLGCFQKGIVVLPKKAAKFRFWHIPTKLNDEGRIITSVYRDKYNTAWVGIEDNGIYKTNSNAEVEATYFPGITIISMLEDSNDNFWVGTYYKGLAKWNRSTNQLEFVNGLKDIRIKSIAEDDKKNLYVAAFGAGVMRYSLNSGEVTPYASTKSGDKRALKNDWVTRLLTDSRARLWIGHYKGIDCYDLKRNEVISLPGDSIIGNRVCYSFIEDSNGNIWIGTNNGLFMWSDKTMSFTKYDSDNGLSNNVICGIAEDDNGNIWCSTFNGLNRIKLKDGKIVKYYTGNGLFDKGYLIGVYSYKKGSRILFGGNSGVTFFNPSDDISEKSEPEVLVTRMYIDGNSVNVNTLSDGHRIIEHAITDVDTIRLSHKDNTFTLEFSTMDFSRADNIYYEYRIKELNSNWTVTSPGEKAITFWRLPYGKYTLEVRACENDNLSPIKKLTVIIDTPWYRTFWAYMLYLIVAAVAYYYIYRRIKQKRLDGINEEKIKFFINISHELRAPLTMIINPLERLMKEERDKPIYRDLKIMHKHSVRVLSLINQLLDIHKMDKGQMKIHCSETDMVQYIEDICHDFNAQAERHAITLTFNHEMEQLPAWIDPNNFDKVMVNLIGNAFKYTPDGGAITVTLSTEKQKTRNGSKTYAVISVADTGKGIDKDKLERVFDRFYQIDSTQIGFGIGLNLCRMMVKLHHGSITACNRGNEPGSEFVVKLPLGNAHLSKKNICTAVEQPMRKEQLYINETDSDNNRLTRSKTNYKILIVDDNDEVRDFVAGELQSEYKVITAHNGEEALREAVAKLPDVIISDVVMPEMDGFQLLKNLKKNVNTNHIPVILLTSKIEQQDRLEGLEKGADAYLTKPVIIDELRTVIANLIANRILLKGKFSGAQEQNDKLKEIDIKSNNDVLMERIMKVINEHLDDSELSVETLADMVGLSRAQLHRKIKEMTGLPASEFIRNIRLKHAASLLKDKKLNVSQVAYAIGFVNLGHFSTVFKKYYGVSPTEYVDSDTINPPNLHV